MTKGIFGVGLAVLLAAGSLAYIQAETKPYSTTKRAILYKGMAAFSVNPKGIDEEFIGPIILDGKVIFISAMYRGILVFEDGKLTRRVQIPRKLPRFFYPDRALVSVVANLGNKILLYDTHGNAFTFSNKSRLKRCSNLFVSPEQYGAGSLIRLTPMTSGVITIPFRYSDSKADTLEIDAKTLRKISDPQAQPSR
jgi:hypothetical protein